MKGVILLCLAASLATATQDADRLNQVREPKVVAAEGYRVSIEETALPAGTHRHKYWGSHSGSVRSVSHILITRTREEVFVPLSAYADLSEVDRIVLQPRKDGVLLLLSGGDAHGSYKAWLLVVGLNVVKRTVRSGEFPDEWNETTVYTYRAPLEAEPS